MSKSEAAKDSKKQSNVVQFQTFSSAVGLSFWHRLSKLKLEKFKLSEESVPIFGEYTVGDFSHAELPAHLSLEAESFEPVIWGSPSKVEKSQFVVPGVLYNTNTIESFKDMDFKSLFSKCSQQIWDDIISGQALQNPNLLNRFLLVTHADLKKYKFYYWFAFPALTFPEPVANLKANESLASYFNSSEISSFTEGIKRQSFPFFLVKRINGAVKVGHLSEWNAFWKDYSDTKTVGFIDPATLPSNPGWPLRNFLILLGKSFKVETLTVICVRDSLSETTLSHSTVFHLKMQTGWFETLKDCPKAVGWEINSQGKLSPNFVSLGATMDPVRLASSSVDLNLRLMQWRLLPGLNLDMLSNTKCLLLGAGTLGCSVARSIMGWGIRDITFVDNGVVSFSNPVRQSLFEFEDCLNGGRPKAEAAAAKLKSIFPGMNSVGINLSIPMPGHPVPKDQVENIKKDYQTLKTLIQQHDVTFILMDSRESRWLPTVIAAASNKLAINVGLGFDSYLVMRHGLPNSSPQLGCYFCNDVVAPQNSQRDRTLDQQCTVTRPGLSAVAGALAVELMVALLHHPQKGNAAADVRKESEGGVTPSPLGIVPHSIRGALAYFSEVLVVGHAYDKCTACSKTILDAFRKDDFNFLLRVFNEPMYLEDLTGLSKMKQEVDESPDFASEANDDFEM